MCVRFVDIWTGRLLLRAIISVCSLVTVYRSLMNEINIAMGLDITRLAQLKIFPNYMWLIVSPGPCPRSHISIYETTMYLFIVPLCHEEETLTNCNITEVLISRFWHSIFVVSIFFFTIRY